jgi:hypothetical protein
MENQKSDACEIAPPTLAKCGMLSLILLQTQTTSMNIYITV